MVSSGKDSFGVGNGSAKLFERINQKHAGGIVQKKMVVSNQKMIRVSAGGVAGQYFVNKGPAHGVPQPALT